MKETVTPEEVEFRITKELPFGEAAALYVEAGWLETPDTALTEKMMRNCYAVSAAFCQGHLIGFMRALSDGVSDAYLLDLVVSGKYRRHGVGARILKELVSHLKAQGMDWILCVAAPGTGPFYDHSSGRKMESYTPLRF